jgi:hypothetical protein
LNFILTQSELSKQSRAASLVECQHRFPQLRACGGDVEFHFQRCGQRGPAPPPPVSSVTRDDHHEIIISPVLADPVRIAGVLTHELIHAAVGVKCGHKGPFRALALGIGLEGKMTATTEGEAFKRLAQPILDGLGPYL